jgi:hypothetical protein
MTIDVPAAHRFVLDHARLLDRRRFELLFGDGDRRVASEPVMRAVLAYQNPDGGFGNALEPDVRSADSQTVCAEVALRMMSELEAVDIEAVRALCDWCAANCFDSGGLPFALPTIVSGPRAPWWQPTPDPSLNPTAAIIGLLTRFGVEHAWIGRATEWCWAELDSNPDAIDHHSALCAIEFLEALASDPRTDRIADVVRSKVVGELVEFDPTAEGYVFSPLQFARHPQALARPWFDDAAIDTHLDALAAKQQADGGWPITWEPPSAAALSEWRAIVTIEALTTLRNYGRP